MLYQVKVCVCKCMSVYTSVYAYAQVHIDTHYIMHIPAQNWGSVFTRCRLTFIKKMLSRSMAAPACPAVKWELALLGKGQEHCMDVGCSTEVQVRLKAAHYKEVHIVQKVPCLFRSCLVASIWSLQVEL